MSLLYYIFVFLFFYFKVVLAILINSLFLGYIKTQNSCKRTCIHCRSDSLPRKS